MMKVLLTGDDGYQALGLRIVATVLKEKGVDVKIAATQKERSSTGGSFPGEGRWGKNTSEGVEALWVDGMPADAVELASHVYGTDFDLLISGANMGVNVGNIAASGTMGAAIHGLNKAVAKKAVALSWRVDRSLIDEGAETIPVAKFAEHPQQTIASLLELIFKNDFWGADFLNCNLPGETPSKLRLCQPMIAPNARFYNYKLEIDQSAGTYKKVPGAYKEQTDDLTYDGAALLAGYATAVHWLANQYVNHELLHLIGAEYDL